MRTSFRTPCASTKCFAHSMPIPRVPPVIQRTSSGGYCAGRFAPGSRARAPRPRAPAYLVPDAVAVADLARLAGSAELCDHLRDEMASLAVERGLGVDVPREDLAVLALEHAIEPAPLGPREPHPLTAEAFEA